MERTHILRIENLDSAILNNNGVKPKPGHIVFFHEPVESDPQGRSRFVSAELITPGS